MQFKFISGFAAMSAIIGPAFANPFPSASTDMDNHTSSNTTWKGVIEGHAYELHGDASVHCPLSFTSMLPLIFNSKLLPSWKLHTPVSSRDLRIGLSPSPRKSSLVTKHKLSAFQSQVSASETYKAFLLHWMDLLIFHQDNPGNVVGTTT